MKRMQQDNTPKEELQVYFLRNSMRKATVQLTQPVGDTVPVVRKTRPMSNAQQDLLLDLERCLSYETCDKKPLHKLVNQITMHY